MAITWPDYSSSFRYTPIPLRPFLLLYDPIIGLQTELIFGRLPIEEITIRSAPFDWGRLPESDDQAIKVWIPSDVMGWDLNFLQ